MAPSHNGDSETRYLDTYCQVSSGPAYCPAPPSLPPHAFRHLCCVWGCPSIVLLETRSRYVHVTVYYWRVCLSGASHVAQVIKDMPATVSRQETAGSVLGSGCHFPVLLPRKSHGQRCLGGYSPREHKELGTTYRLKRKIFFSHIHE